MMRVVATFDSPDALARAARACEDAGCRPGSACSPAFNETLLGAVGATRSPVAIYALAGGIVGAMCGFALTLGTVREWPGLIVSGKPLVAMPPFLIIAFELTILMASIAAIVSFLVVSARARAAAGGGCGLDRLVDRRGVERGAVAFSAVIADVIHPRAEAVFR